MSSKTNRLAEEVRAGDTSNIKFMSPFPDGNGGASNLGNTSYTCRTTVMSDLGGTLLVDKTITAFDTTLMYFEVVLEPADTSILPPGNYYWVTVIENTGISPLFRKEKHIDLVVTEQGVV